MQLGCITIHQIGGSTSPYDKKEFVHLGCSRAGFTGHLSSIQKFRHKIKKHSAHLRRLLTTRPSVGHTDSCRTPWSF